VFSLDPSALFALEREAAMAIGTTSSLRATESFLSLVLLAAILLVGGTQPVLAQVPCGTPRLSPVGPAFWGNTAGPCQGEEALGVNALAITATGAVLASTGSAGVFRSTDDGKSWVSSNTGIPTNNVAVVGVTTSGTAIAGTHSAGIFRSTDNGVSWAHDPGSSAHTTSFLATPGVVYMADGFFCSGVYRSTDDGITWQAINNGLSRCVNALTRTNSGVLLAGTGTSGVYRSTDGGNSWQEANVGLPDTNLRALSVDTNDAVLVGTNSRGVYRSTDHGSTWNAWNNGIDPDGQAKGINVLTHDSTGVTLAGGYYSGRSWRIQDQATTWVDTTTGIAVNATSINAISVRNDGYAFLAASTVYRKLVPSGLALGFPLAGLTALTANIASVIDHSGTPLDPTATGTKSQYWYGKDCRVTAFDGETGDTLRNCPPSGFAHRNANGTYHKFCINGHYRGDLGTCNLPDLTGCRPVDLSLKLPIYYLNYDGHPGYDFPPATTDASILAVADGILRIPAVDPIDSPAGPCAKTPWDEFHTFYIDHGHGLATWYLHASDLTPAVKRQIEIHGFAPVKARDAVALVGRTDNTCTPCKGPTPCIIPIHLHFETRTYPRTDSTPMQVQKNGIVTDLYGEALWQACASVPCYDTTCPP